MLPLTKIWVMTQKKQSTNLSQQKQKFNEGKARESRHLCLCIFGQINVVFGM